MKKKKNEHPTMPILFAGLIAVVLFLIFLSITVKNSPSSPANQTACTMDAKLCPDGTAVGRVPPLCEFAKCK